MFQQPLYDSSGNTVLSKDRTEGLSQIVKFDITQPKLFTYLGPSVLAETTVEYCLGTARTG
ncbi:hypothetical protein ES703_06342 [subsurface metagenome]